MILSVIVPVYNVEKYLSKCVDSILGQTFSDYELILVDDGSTDGSSSLCDLYAGKDARIKVIHKANGGLSDARNKGLDCAQGEYVCFIDSDDWVRKDMFELMVGKALSCDADMVVCGIESVDENGNVLESWQRYLGEVTLTREEILDEFYTKYKDCIRGSACNKLYRATVFDDLRFPIGILYEDMYILLDTIFRTRRIAFTEERLYFYFTTRGDSLMQPDYTPRKFASLDFAKHHWDCFEEYGNVTQIRYAREKYISVYIHHMIMIKTRFKKLYPDFKRYRKEFRLFDVLFHDYVCIRKRMVLAASYFAPRWAYRQCEKYFPECFL